MHRDQDCLIVCSMYSTGALGVLAYNDCVMGGLDYTHLLFEFSAVVL